MGGSLLALVAGKSSYDALCVTRGLRGRLGVCCWLLQLAKARTTRSARPVGSEGNWAFVAGPCGQQMLVRRALRDPWAQRAIEGSLPALVAGKGLYDMFGRHYGRVIDIQ